MAGGISPTFSRCIQVCLQYLGFGQNRPKRITDEPIDSIDEVGDIYTEEGLPLRATGEASGLEERQIVPVLYSRKNLLPGHRGVKSSKVLMHQARKADAQPIQPLLGTPVVEELFVLSGTVWFRNWAVFAEIIPQTSIPLDNPTHQFVASWGFGDRMFFLTVSPTPGDARNDYYLIYALDRPEGGPSASAAPKAIFVRRVDRPQSLVVDTILGDPLTFHGVIWTSWYLGSSGASNRPMDAAMIWAGTKTYDELFPTTTTHHAIGYLVEDRNGAARLVWRAEDALTDTLITEPSGEGVGTAIRTPVYDVQVAYWDPDGDQRVAWVLGEHTRTILDTAVSRSALITISERTDSVITAGIDRISGAVLWRFTFTTSTTWTVPPPTPQPPPIPVGEDVISSVHQGVVELQVGQGDAVFYRTITAYSVAGTRQESDPTAPFVIYPGSPSEPGFGVGLALITSPMRDIFSMTFAGSPSPSYTLDSLTTHRTALVRLIDPVPPGTNDQWGVINLAGVTPAMLGTTTPFPTPTDAQNKIGALITLPASQDRLWHAIHVVYDVPTLSRAGDA